MKSAKTSRSGSPASLLKPCDPEALQGDIQQIQLAIARRAYELFESRNREHGHDWEDWFQAESELLRPVSIAVSEAADRFSIRANVLGFSPKELKVGIEPTRVVIVGKKEDSHAAGTEQAPPAGSSADQLLRLIALSSEVDPAGAAVELQSGVLRFELNKKAAREAMAAAAGTA
jgi:HSP20 family molecular chaperone IbpA